MKTLNRWEKDELRGLVDEAEKYAHWCMKHKGGCHATVFMKGPKGNHAYCPEDLSSEERKDAFANTVRLMCVANRAEAVVFVSEAWSADKEKGRKLDLRVPPSQSPDRREIIMAMGESREGRLDRFLPIIRPANGKFINLGEAREAGHAVAQGRFTELLSKDIPNEQAVKIAQELLTKMGLRTECVKSQRRDFGVGLS